MDSCFTKQYGNLGSHNTFYKNLGDDNNPLSSYDLTLKGGAKSDNEISYLIFIKKSIKTS